MSTQHSVPGMKESRSVCPGEVRRALTAQGLCVAVVATVLLAGCSFHRVEPPRPPVTLPGAFSATGKGPLPEKWWTALGDAQLSSLIAQSLTGNMSLSSTWDRLEQARAEARKAGADLLPGIEATTGASRSVRKARSMPGTYWNAFSLGVSTSYEVDLWGRVRAARRAATLDMLVSEQDLRAAAMSLSAEVAGAWYRLIELRGRLGLLDEQVETNRDYLNTITLRFRRSQVPATDVLQQRQVLESARGERVRVQSDLQVEEHRLAVLLGQAPAAFRAPDGRLPQLPSLPATGLPAEWIQRRPDIQAAFLRVQAADHRVAGAIADRFPKIRLSATDSTSEEVLHNLFDNWLASLAANLVAPLFDAGQRKAQVDRTRAVTSERLHVYGQVLLESLEEVENALVQEARQREYLQSLQKQLELSRQAMDQSFAGYVRGTTDFTRFLTTRIAHQQLDRSHLQAQRDLVLLRIALYRALGGGWELPFPVRRQ